MTLKEQGNAHLERMFWELGFGVFCGHVLGILGKSGRLGCPEGMILFSAPRHKQILFCSTTLGATSLDAIHTAVEALYPTQGLPYEEA